MRELWGKIGFFFEKRSIKIFCFYISYANGRFYFRIAEKPSPLVMQNLGKKI